MLCQICSQQPAKVCITEITKESWIQAPPGKIPEPSEQRNICEQCAANLNLFFSSTPPKNVVSIWKLLQESARKAREGSALSCKECGMTLAEFRSKGRLGCPKDYEVFQPHLLPLVQRVHNAVRHRGRLPGMNAEDFEKLQHLSKLRAELAKAVRNEAYENAAELRDRIQELELGSKPA